MNTYHMQQGLKSSIAGVVAAATLLAGGILTVPHAMALEADGQYYSSKQPYVAPSEATTASYSQAPEGYETVSPSRWLATVHAACPATNTTHCL